MSTLSQFWQKHRHRWHRRGIDKAHGLRRHLAYYVARHGFQIGDYSYGTPVIRSWGEGARLIVGHYCSIATGVEFILGGHHRPEHVTTFPMSAVFGTDPRADGPWSRGDIVIGSDVWIAAGATILSGVSIGDGAVVGARAVVTQDVPPYAVVAGNPARIIRKRFSDEIVNELLTLRWWTMRPELLRPLLPLLQSERLDAFIEECRKIQRSSPAPAPAPDPITRAGTTADAGRLATHPAGHRP
jgi:acetyltransferase-like isoleucine patch superfamily enzyme